MKTTPESPADSLGVLGKPIKPAAPPAPTWRPTETKGIERNSAGQIRTNSPEPSPIWTAPAAPVAAPPPINPGVWDEQGND